MAGWRTSVAKGGKLVKAAPTFNPQALVSLRRLQERLDDGGFAGRWRLEGGNIVRLERSQQTFLSAEPTSNVVGATRRTCCWSWTRRRTLSGTSS